MTSTYPWSLGLLCCWPGNFELSAVLVPDSFRYPALSSDSFRRKVVVYAIHSVQRSRDYCDAIHDV